MHLLPLKSYYKPARKYQSQGISCISTTFGSSAAITCAAVSQVGVTQACQGNRPPAAWKDQVQCHSTATWSWVLPSPHSRIPTATLHLPSSSATTCTCQTCTQPGGWATKGIMYPWRNTPFLQNNSKVNAVTKPQHAEQTAPKLFKQ